MLSHRVNCLRSFPSLGVERDGGTVCMFPLFHMAGWSLALGAWQARRPIHFVRTPDADDAARASRARRRATRIYAIPAVWARILEHGVDGYDLIDAARSRHRHVGDAARARRRDPRRAPRTSRRASSTARPKPGPATILGHARPRRASPGSVGLPQPGVELRLADDGEVCLRSELLMDGYFDNPDATAAALDADGWYHSGDLGVLDDEGYLSIVGRVRDVLRTGGETVAPAEVEAVLADHPAVAEVAVVGLPDPQWGEVVCAVVVAAAGAAAADRRRPPGPLRRAAWPASSSPGGSRSWTPSPAPRRPARSSGPCSSSASPPGWNKVPGVENVVSTLADRSLADRHEAYAAEIRTLLDAALTVMRRDETIDPRVSDIVRTAGLSNQAFYRHFRGKDELLVALLDDGRQRLLATIERRMAPRRRRRRDQVRAWIEAVLAQARDPEAAAATRPFAVNGDRLAVQFPDETLRLARPARRPAARAIVGDARRRRDLPPDDGHGARRARHAPTRRREPRSDRIVEFALKGCGLGT